MPHPPRQGAVFGSIPSHCSFPWRSLVAGSPWNGAFMQLSFLRALPFAVFRPAPLLLGTCLAKAKAQRAATIPLSNTQSPVTRGSGITQRLSTIEATFENNLLALPQIDDRLSGAARQRATGLSLPGGGVDTALWLEPPPQKDQLKAPPKILPRLTPRPRR